MPPFYGATTATTVIVTAVADADANADASANVDADADANVNVDADADVKNLVQRSPVKMTAAVRRETAPSVAAENF